MSSAAKHTAWWARTESVAKPVEHTPLDASAKEALERSAPAAGAAWNAASTWEEKDITQWTKQKLPELFSGLELVPAHDVAETSELNADEANATATLRATSVSSVDGEATYVLSRGKQRVVFELELKLECELEIRAGGELKRIIAGRLVVPELASDELDRTSLPPHKVTGCDESAMLFGASVKKSWPALQQQMRDFVVQAKEKWR